VSDLALVLYRQRRSYLLAIACRNADNERIAEEALQEAFIIFLRAYDPRSGAPPLAWLTTTLKRECWRRSRRERIDRETCADREREHEESGAVIESLPSAASETEQFVCEVDEARQRLGELKPDERTALGLFGAGYSYREIGERREWTHTKVHRCVREGRGALREQATA
jgi:RNA polymerase sigma factor (sigma-70 family)